MSHRRQYAAAATLLAMVIVASSEGSLIGQEPERDSDAVCGALRGLCMRDDVRAYSERQVCRGSLGTFDARDLLPIALAEAGRLKKYGA